MDKRAARQATIKSLRRIACARGHKRTQAIRKHFHDYPVKLDAAYRALKSTASREQVERMARRINPFQPCQSPVLWWPQPKKTGGYRSICKLPVSLRAASLMVRDVLQVMYQAGPHAYGIKGRGRDVEARNIAASLQTYEWCYDGDIRSCFDNVNMEALYSLPLPPSVIRNTLDTRSIRFLGSNKRRTTHTTQHYYYRDDHCVGRTDPRGLMQGSPASNIVLAWLLNDMPSTLPEDCAPFLLVDNVLVAARTEQECRAIEQTLCSFFAAHHAGPFALHGEVKSVSAGFDRAGYSYKKWLAGDFEVAPTHSNYMRLYDALEEALETDRAACAPSH